MKIIDISPTISERIAVFPGDTPFKRKIAMDFEADDHLLLSSIRSTVHLGAHADAPNHYHPSGADIAARPLNRYLGPCQVIRVSLSRGARIAVADLGDRVIQAERILFRTDSFPNPNHWNGDFNSLSPALIHFLAEKGVRLVGIDTPSVDPEQSKELESHQEIFHHDMAVLEGLVLTEVADGLYDLIALPLKIEGGDASPVRAILLPKGSLAQDT